jgi:hypothetical protein
MVKERSELRVIADRWAYDVEDRLPSGPSAHTYGGVDLKTGEEIVVKIFRDSAGDRGRDRFQREARLHQALDHRSILPLLDHGTDDGSDYIVTRRLRPGSLWNVLREDPTPPLSKIQTIGVQIADALAYMHGRDEVHGDISPGNILLDEAGNAYLADFGFSKRVETMPVATSGDAYGTAGFRAPRELGTARTYEDDVYSLAAVLWLCLTGDPPSQWARGRRRELPNRTLRAPLERALRWDSEQPPSAEAFARGLKQGWAKVAKDWRAQPSRRRRSPMPLLLAGAAVGLIFALFLGQVLKPKPALAGETVLDRGGVTLRLPGDWHRKAPPQLPTFRLRSPVAAGRGRTLIVAARTPLAGAALLSAAARRTLPRKARKARPVLIGERTALSYGPANQFGGSVEVLAMPLKRAVLIVRCAGPAPTLVQICSQVAVNVQLEVGAVQPLAPTSAIASRIRFLVDRFKDNRGQEREQLAEVSKEAAGAKIAGRLAKLNRDFGDRMSSLPTNAQDSRAINAVERSAKSVAEGYERLADASTPAAWATARAVVGEREQRLEANVETLRRLRVYPAPS